MEVHESLWKMHSGGIWRKTIAPTAVRQTKMSTFFVVSVLPRVLLPWFTFYFGSLCFISAHVQPVFPSPVFTLTFSQLHQLSYHSHHLLIYNLSRCFHVPLTLGPTPTVSRHHLTVGSFWLSAKHLGPPVHAPCIFFFLSIAAMSALCFHLFI